MRRTTALGSILCLLALAIIGLNVPVIAVKTYHLGNFRVCSVVRKPAIDAGFQRGDIILFADGNPVEEWGVFVNATISHIDRPVKVRVRRGRSVLDLVVVPDRFGVGITYGFELVVGSERKSLITII